MIRRSCQTSDFPFAPRKTRDPTPAAPSSRRRKRRQGAVRRPLRSGRVALVVGRRAGAVLGRHRGPPHPSLRLAAAHARGVADGGTRRLHRAACARRPACRHGDRPVPRPPRARWRVGRLAAACGAVPAHGHALQRRPHRSRRPLLGHQHGPRHGAGGRRGRAVSLRRSRAVGAARDRARHRQRPRLEPRRPHAVPLRFASLGAPRVELRPRRRRPCRTRAASSST